ncbi:DUF2207 domain-containing protein [Breoghania sp.]|uniref:DUF2207 domain-containing protein n=1 Tax=Breoghania sp. TaxID=2065378 RepID=UPI0026232101|nr:DUF2207 domain-containing protein [Breoghania sp.]MDJ0930316.1 DUF2207 domain-containing protein [Breoghania sp.]
MTSLIHIEADGTLRVTETIEVSVEGNQIKRGIYRDFPLTFRDGGGTRHRVDFELLSVTRDGTPEPYKENRSGDDVRIYIDDPDGRLAHHHHHLYAITYETTRQIRFFDDHDELYWNVTGQEWAFPIDAVTARVVLPEGVTAIKWTAFTGRFGEKGQDWIVAKDNGGRELIFSTTRPLSVNEGLSVAVAMPKGTIATPTSAESVGYFWLDHRGEIVAIAGLALVFAYFCWAWLRVGRDPKPGTTIPLFSAPEGVSPALADYIYNNGFSDGGWRALSAACINLAVKGYLELADLESEPVLTTTGEKDDPENGIRSLPPGEAAVIKTLGHRPLKLTKENGKRVQMLGTKFSSAIVGENRGRFFKSNAAYWLPDFLLSILAVAALLFFGNLGETDIIFFVIVMTFVTMATLILVKLALTTIRNRSVSQVVQFILTMAVLLIFAGSVGTQITSLAFATEGTPFIIVSIVALLWGNTLFYHLMGAPTALGREMLDELEGLKLYLSVAERERMNMRGAPEMSPSHFETLLPYAIALRVEKPWSETFQSWLVSAAAAGPTAASYSPVWYHGAHFEPRSFGSAMSIR